MSRSLVDPVDDIPDVVESADVGLADVFSLLLELLDRHVILEATIAELLERIEPSDG